MIVSSFNSCCIYRSIYMKNFIYQSIYFNIAQYMISYFDHICFHISGVIRPLHISVNISPLRLNHFNITYIDQYMPTSGIYRSIYVIFQWFKLGAYIGPIYVRSYNDRYIKTYILPISYHRYASESSKLLDAIVKTIVEWNFLESNRRNSC